VGLALGLPALGVLLLGVAVWAVQRLR